MGIYNCDRPAFFRQGKPIVTFSLDRKAISGNEIANASAFNNNLTSVIGAVNNSSNWELPVFREQNSIVMSTKKGDIGILTGKDFNSMNIDSLLNRENPKIHFNLRKIEVPGSEEEFRRLLDRKF